MVEIIEVPALADVMKPNVIWWSEKYAFMGDKRLKGLWRKIDRAKLPNQTIAPMYPGGTGAPADWEEHKRVRGCVCVKQIGLVLQCPHPPHAPPPSPARDAQEFVDQYNSGLLPEEFLWVGAYPKDTTRLRVFPGLAQIAKQYPFVLRALTPTPCARALCT